MKKNVSCLFVICLIGLNVVPAQNKSESKLSDSGKYATAESKEIIEKMINAHGGLKKWQEKKSISFRHTYIGPFEPNDPWTSDEIIEAGSRRVYQDWPLDKAQIIYDGTDFYGVNWVRGNPPKFTAHLAMYFSNLPWLTQDNGVKLGEVKQRKLPGNQTNYYTVKMGFENSVGESSKDYYDLYIDPKTYLLVAFEYIVTYGALLDLIELPAGLDFMGPFIKYIDDYRDVDGLKVPKKLRTVGSKGEDFGYHIYENWSFSKAFDANLVKIPANAVKDKSSHIRKKM